MLFKVPGSANAAATVVCACCWNAEIGYAPNLVSVIGAYAFDNSAFDDVSVTFVCRAKNADEPREQSSCYWINSKLGCRQILNRGVNLWLQCVQYRHLVRKGPVADPLIYSAV